MASVDFDKLNNKLQDTSRLFLACIGIILLIFWFFAFGLGEIHIPLIIIALVSAVQYFIISPKMQKTIEGLKEAKK